jgi:class 3 adenylate cyclase
MTTEKVKRKLTGILSADVKGYSRLMGGDEVGTLRILQTYRGVISDLIQKKGCRVVDAVTFAVKIQEILRTEGVIFPRRGHANASYNL